METNSKVYVKTDYRGVILSCDGGYSASNIKDISDWILIDEGLGDKYNLCQSHYFGGQILTEDGIPRYKLVDGKPVKRTPEEIQADRDAMPLPPPTEQEQLRADIDFLAAMQGVTL